MTLSLDDVEEKVYTKDIFQKRLNFFTHRRRIRTALSGTDLRTDVQGGGLLLERGVQGVLGYNKRWAQTFRKS